MKDRLTERLVEMKNELDNSKYQHNHEYPMQFMQMLSFTAGYAPEMSIREAHDLVNKILKGQIKSGQKIPC